MIKLVARKHARCSVDRDVCEYIADTEADVVDLPKAYPGSTCIVVASGNAYMVNASGEWALFGGEA